MKRLIIEAVKWFAAFLGLAWIRRDAVKDAQTQENLKAQERMNEADTGVGATDSERVERLRDMAAKWKRG